MGLFLGMLFGAVGTGYLIYGKRQYSAVFAIAGALLVLYPYFFSSALSIVLIGAALIAAPFVFQRLS
jgi:hypothetical protein